MSKSDNYFMFFNYIYTSWLAKSDTPPKSSKQVIRPENLLKSELTSGHSISQKIGCITMTSRMNKLAAYQLMKATDRGMCHNKQALELNDEKVSKL